MVIPEGAGGLGSRVELFARTNSTEHERSLKRHGRAPPIVLLNNKDLAAQQLLEYLLKRAHISESPQRRSLQQEGALIPADYRRDEQRSLVTGQFECSCDGSTLANVEHAICSSP